MKQDSIQATLSSSVSTLLEMWKGGHSQWYGEYEQKSILEWWHTNHYDSACCVACRCEAFLAQACARRKRPDTTGTVLHVSMCETQLWRAILLHDSLTEWHKQIKSSNILLCTLPVDPSNCLAQTRRVHTVHIIYIYVYISNVCIRIYIYIYMSKHFTVQ